MLFTGILQHNFIIEVSVCHKPGGLGLFGSDRTPDFIAGKVVADPHLQRLCRGICQIKGHFGQGVEFFIRRPQPAIKKDRFRLGGYREIFNDHPFNGGADFQHRPAPESFGIFRQFKKLFCLELIY